MRKIASTTELRTELQQVIASIQPGVSRLEIAAHLHSLADRVAAELTLYEVTGNIDPKRLGKVFYTGWTPLTSPGKTPVQIAAHKSYNTVRGTTVTVVGTISRADVAKKQKTAEWGFNPTL